MLTIMLVDDNLDDLNGIRDFVPWKDLDCSIVATATNGAEGLTRALEVKPNIIITDISMPIMDGIEMTKRILESLPDTHFIFMSCFDDFEYAQSAIQYGVSSYVLKPIIVDELVEALLKAKEQEEAEVKKALEEYNLRMQISESMPILRENFFVNLLAGGNRDKHFVNRQASFLEIDMTCQYHIFAVQIDVTDSNGSIDSIYLDLQVLRDLLAEHLLKENGGYSVGYELSALACIVPAGQFDEEEMMDRIYLLQQDFENRTGNTVTVCLGTKSTELADIGVEFKRIATALRRDYFAHNGAIITTGDVLQEQKELALFDIGAIYEDISALFSNRMDEIDQFVDKYYGDFCSGGQNYYQSLTLCIANVLSIEFINRNITAEQIFGDDMALWNKIYHYRTIVNVPQWVKNVLLLTKAYLFEREVQDHQKIIESIKHIIDQRYAELQTLDQVVEDLYISVGYASRLFRQYANETIFDYLTRTKMEKAKEMLLCKDLKAYEVGQRLGYSSNAYFTTSFKKYTGLTPKEYRMKQGV